MLRGVSVIATLLLPCLPLGALRGESVPAAIDRLIAAGAGGPLAPAADDAEFLRRIHLDLAGNIPTSAQTHAFLGDKSADKRSRVIDQLLASENFAEHWTDRLSVMLLERQQLSQIPDDEWRAYLKNNLRGQPRWNVLVGEMIAGTGKGESRAAMRFLGKGNHHRLTEDIARLFLGRDLECARCHDHPSVDDWTQAHYWGLYAYLNQTRLATHSGEKRPYFVENLATRKVEFQSVFFEDKEDTGPRLPDGKEVLIPKFEENQGFEKPAADGLPAVPIFRPRELLARDLASGQNSLFVRNSVNRFWKLMMGRGFWMPLDQAHSENPPSHPDLLDLLERQFVAQQFDLKWLLRQIALSASYQRSSRLPPGEKETEPADYRVACLKGLTPEQLLHAILRATGNEDVRTRKSTSKETFDRRGYFTGTNSKLPTAYSDIRTIFAETFGQPPGVAEDDFAPGLNKALFLMNDRLILHWLQPREQNLASRLARMESPDAIAKELYCAVLCRLPEEDEREELSAYLETHHERRTAAVVDLIWALLTSTEFRLNH
ncbi:MAG: DUF1549 and DUF1553 domain-containing protein [Roseibacillus sp.]|nr:DUF1549 and DUF1553 domain-containing protein [Roseibacillus sp.]